MFGHFLCSRLPETTIFVVSANVGICSTPSKMLWNTLCEHNCSNWKIDFGIYVLGFPEIRGFGASFSKAKDKPTNQNSRKKQQKDEQEINKIQTSKESSVSLLTTRQHTKKHSNFEKQESKNTKKTRTNNRIENHVWETLHKKSQNCKQKMPFLFTSRNQTNKYKFETTYSVRGRFSLEMGIAKATLHFPVIA